MTAAACIKTILDMKQQTVSYLGLSACSLSGALLEMEKEGVGTKEERKALGKTISAITAIECELAKTLPSTNKRFIEAAMEGAVPAEGIDPPLTPDKE